MNPLDLLITEDAEADMKEAFEWYRTLGSGLEQELLRAIETCLWSIRRNPNLFPSVYRNVQRALIRKFPYGIFYFVFEETVVVLACFHTKRNPKDWQDRV